MALDDVVFQEGEIQDFTVEIAAGTLFAPVDILFENESSQYPVQEIIPVASVGSIFIMSE